MSIKLPEVPYFRTLNIEKNGDKTRIKLFVMEALSTRINSLPVSATLAMAAKARELKNQGVDVIGLSLGEPDFNTPEFIKDAAIQAVNDNYNSYSPQMDMPI